MSDGVKACENAKAISSGYSPPSLELIYIINSWCRLDGIGNGTHPKNPKQLRD